MRTAVVRINIDPADELSEPARHKGMELLAARAADAGISVIDSSTEEMPAHRREVQLLMTGDNTEVMQRDAVQLCEHIFGMTPALGAVTFISRGTDDDAQGVLAGFGITGDISRTTGTDEFDIITVELTRADLERVPESRIHTALEAATNCEIRIVTR